MDTSLQLVSIRDIQGIELWSPYATQQLRTTGVVTGVLRRGFYLQTPNVDWDQLGSDAIFIYSPDWTPAVGSFLELSGTVVDYLKHVEAKPVTQIHLDQVRPKRNRSGDLNIEPVLLTAEMLNLSNAELATLLNALEGMLVKFGSGNTFIAPSNPFGDYVLALDADGWHEPSLRSPHNGVIVSAENPLRWYPGFRVYNYNHAPRLNVGAKLRSTIMGPLHYRVDAWQVAVHSPFEFEPAFVERNAAQLKPAAGSLTIMTLNCFNLDPHVESQHKVQNPLQDVDDDWGDGRFHTLAQAVVLQAHCPDIIALQEIQDDDGAEQTLVASAGETYQMLVDTIEQLSGIAYRWVNIDPLVGADGGQPGGNIRNGYLYNPKRVSVIEDSVKVLGRDNAAFIDSRKPLMTSFIESESGAELTCINVHLASKRHQRSIFAPLDPGLDAKLAVRIAQANCVAQQAQQLLAAGREFYITGDFNDTEHSQTLQTLTADFATNLVLQLPENERYDYNHRGKLQVLMHGLVSNAMAARHAQYEIIHGNELIGVQAGEASDKPSDHAYVLAKLNLAA